MTLPFNLFSSTIQEGGIYSANLSSFSGEVVGGISATQLDGFLNLTDWFYEYVPKTGTLTVKRKDGIGDTLTVIDGVMGLTEISFTFDKRMNYVVTYKRADTGIFYVYFLDTLTAQYVEIPIEGATSVRAALESLHPDHYLETNVVLIYVRKEKQLFYRKQSDRFQRAHLIKDFDGKAKIISAGYTDKNRFQYEVLEASG